MTQHFAMYGKGGVGKSTLALNLSAALVELGHSVLLLAGDAKGGCTTLLQPQEPRSSVMELLASKQRPRLDQIVTRGYRGIACIEVGDSSLLGECTSSGIARTLNLLHEIDAFGELNPDVAIYDLPGEPGCLRFSGPRGLPETHKAFVVTSSDVMSLYTVNSILRSLEQKGSGTPCALIANGLNGPFEESLVDDFAKRVNSMVIGHIPRSLVVKQCELYGKTVMEAAPLSNHSYVYRRLARHITDDRVVSSLPLPRPLAPDDLKAWASRWGDRLYELEHGVIRDGAGI